MGNELLNASDSIRMNNIGNIVSNLIIPVSYVLFEMRVIRHNRLILDLISVYVEPGVLKSHAYHVSYCQGSPDHDFA